VAPVDKSYTIYYQSAIVRAALSCTVVDLFDAENIVDLEIWDSGHSKVISIKKPAYGFLFVFHSNYGSTAVSLTVSRQYTKVTEKQSPSQPATQPPHDGIAWRGNSDLATCWSDVLICKSLFGHSQNRRCDGSLLQ